MKQEKIVLLLILVILVGFVVVLGVKKLYLASPPQKSSNIPSEISKPVQLELEYPYEALNVTDSEKEEISQFVKTFETLQYERKAKEILALFTPPTNKDERDQLDFLEGKDLNSSPRLYSTAEFNCYLNWYMIRGIEKDSAGISVALKELRTYYNNDIADYTAKVDDFTLALSLKEDSRYQVEGYSHKESPAKYDGFDCL